MKNAATSAAARGAMMSFVTFMVSPLPQGAEPLALRVAGKTISERQLGIPFHVDPGQVSIEVLRGSVVLEKQEVTATEGATAWSVLPRDL